MSAHPETAALAKAAFEASGCRTHQEFIDLFRGAVGLRTFRDWLAGTRAPMPLATMVLRAFVDGWRPTS